MALRTVRNCIKKLENDTMNSDLGACDNDRIKDVEVKLTNLRVRAHRFIQSIPADSDARTDLEKAILDAEEDTGTWVPARALNAMYADFCEDIAALQSELEGQRQCCDHLTAERDALRAEVEAMRARAVGTPSPTEA